MAKVVLFDEAPEFKARFEAAEDVPTPAVTDELTHELADVTRAVPAGVALGAMVAVVRELCERCQHPKRAKLAFIAALTLGQGDAWIEPGPET